MRIYIYTYLNSYGTPRCLAHPYIYIISHTHIYIYIYVRYHGLLPGWNQSDSKTSNQNSSPLKRPKHITISFILPVCAEQKQHHSLNSIPNLLNVWIVSLQCTQSCSSLEAMGSSTIRKAMRTSRSELSPLGASSLAIGTWRCLDDHWTKPKSLRLGVRCPTTRGEICHWLGKLQLWVGQLIMQIAAQKWETRIHEHRLLPSARVDYNGFHFQTTAPSNKKTKKTKNPIFSKTLRIEQDSRISVDVCFCRPLSGLDIISHLSNT